MNPRVNNPVPGNPWRSIPPTNCPRPRANPSQTGPSAPEQVEIKHERKPPEQRLRKLSKARMTQICTDYLAALYPHISKSHLRAALLLTENDLLESTIILNMVYKYGSGKDRIHPPLHPSARVHKEDPNGTTTAGSGTSSGTASVAPSAPACGITFGTDSYGPLYGASSGTTSYIPVSVLPYIPVDTSYAPSIMSPSTDVNKFYMMNHSNHMVTMAAAAQKMEASDTSIPETPSFGDSSEMVLDESNESAAVAMPEGDVLTTREHPNVPHPPDAVYDCLEADCNEPPVPCQSPRLEEDIKRTPPVDKVGIVIVKCSDGYKSFLL